MVKKRKTKNKIEKQKTETETSAPRLCLTSHLPSASRSLYTPSLKCEVQRQNETETDVMIPSIFDFRTSFSRGSGEERGGKWRRRMGQNSISMR